MELITPCMVSELVSGLPKPEALEMIRRFCPPESEHFDTDEFGRCPEGPATCPLLLLNIYSSHYLTCPEHQLYWCIGENLFSGWRDGTEEEWERNYRTLQGYTRSDGAHCCCVKCVAPIVNPAPQEDIPF